MTKDYKYSDYINKGLQREVEVGLDSIYEEIQDAPLFVKEVVSSSVNNYRLDRFAYDGSTLVNERYYNKTRFEAASLAHDDLNSQGYVGYRVDMLFIVIMLVLEYPKWMIFHRSLLMFSLTWINVLRHKYFSKSRKANYKGDIQLKKYIR